ncbi:MAG: S-adenosylmethionine synthetase [Bacteriovoracaceae bacterium]|nr:S-adenosylmethionine synthetase [Bacteriovoracaceae bacterium]
MPITLNRTDRPFLFTSESVTEGHPDKVADQISDGVLDAILAQDPKARVACETLVTTGVVIVAGEITTSCYVHFPDIVRNTIEKIGYDHSEMGFDYKTCAVVSSIDKQSPDISMGVTEGEGLHKEQGAGDQGLMFGYACNETEEYMPAPIQYSHQLARKLAQVRKTGKLDFLWPDGKTQVTMQYEKGKPTKIVTVVISTQHKDSVSHAKLSEAVIEEVVKPTLPAHLISKETRYLINPTGRFVIGGPQGDCGLTGRKIIVDTYGGAAPHGGGAFSGKDPSKVDRSAAYMARYIAKNVVASGAAEKCLLQIAYAIGVAEPVSVFVDCGGTAKVDEAKIEAAVKETFGLKPAQIIKTLDLQRPIYSQTAAYGHFGTSTFPWEKLDRKDDLKRLLKV